MMAAAASNDADDDDCWDAFGSSSSDEDDDNDASDQRDDHDIAGIHRAAAAAADATALRLTQDFASAHDGVPISGRVVALGDVGSDGENDILCRQARNAVEDRLRRRGMNAMVVDGGPCDAAVLFRGDGIDSDAGGGAVEASIRRRLVPGGILLLVVVAPSSESGGGSDTQKEKDAWELLSRRWTISASAPSSSTSTVPNDAVWDVGGSSVVHRGGEGGLDVVRVIKRSCPIDSSSCPWKDNGRRVPPSLSIDGGAAETFLQHECRIASLVSVVPSVHERKCATRNARRRRCAEDDVDSANGEGGRCGDGSSSGNAGALLTNEHIDRAVRILREYGFVVLRDIFDPSETCRWGQTVLSDFAAAAATLKSTRGVDVLNPGGDGGGNGGEVLSYREMAMREDLRVDLRDGPSMAKLRAEVNSRALYDMQRASGCTEGSGDCGDKGAMLETTGLNDDGPNPTVTTADGTLESWRFHPSVLRIIRKLFNPIGDPDAAAAAGSTAATSAAAARSKDGIELFKGNFGRWNFAGGKTGPDGSPQPLRVGQIGSVISCPGAADQAIHADAPHLFEHLDCLPCHYADVFTPGVEPCGAAFDADGNRIGEVSAGGTAFVYSSHRLGVTAWLTASEGTGSENGHGSATTTSVSAAAAPGAREEMHLRTVRPSLGLGDALIFDTRLLHFGLANRKQPHQDSGFSDEGSDRGRRPMLYMNATQAWFHDPKNFDDHERIF